MSDGKVVFDITGNLSGINSALNAATNTIARDTAKWTVLGQTAMNALTSAAKAGFNAIKDLARNAFEYNSQMETYEVNFKTLLGSAEAAQIKMAELKQYAAKTPFAFADLADATQTLLAFQVSSEDASLALKHLGDISLGDANKLKSLTLAFGQVSSAGKLAGNDLLQMINAGFNPLKVIAEETGVAYADLRAVMSGEKTSEDFKLRMEAARREVEELGVNASESAIMLAQIGKDGMISADMVAAAMRIATSEGHAYHNALLNASTTAQGQISTIKDSWDMLTGKMTGGVFDALSTNVLPKVIEWLDELNAAFDEGGFAGLKTAAGRIFDEIGGMAFDLGAGLITQLYNGITGDDATIEEVKAYLTEIFGAASDAAGTLKDFGLGALEWIRDNGELVGAAATSIGIGLGIFAIMSNPLAGILTALAGALLLFATDWGSFEEKYPNIVKAFEDITGVDFSTFASGVESAKTKLTAFYNDALVPLFTWLSEHGEAVQLALAGIGVALMLMGAPVAGLALLLGVIITNWEDIKTAVDNAVSAMGTFFTQTIPDSWNQLMANVKQAWQDNVCAQIDKAAKSVADFLGIQVPKDWSLTKAIGEAWDALAAKIDGVMKKIADFFGLETNLVVGEETGSGVHQTNNGRDAGGAGLSFASSDPEMGRFANWSEESKEAARQYTRYFNEYSQGNKARWDAMEGCLQKIAKDPNANADDFIDAFNQLQTQFTNGIIELPVSWFEGAEASLQSELDGMNFSTTVDAVIRPLFSRTDFTPMFDFDGLTGTDHAAGGIFTSASRFIGLDGMHTIGESGAEALLPLDTLWRKMGLTFDQAFAANLEGLQYSIMPQIPAAAPAAFDPEELSQTIAGSIREALAGLTVEMDKRTVGKMLVPEVSRDIANEVKGKKWTA